MMNAPSLMARCDSAYGWAKYILKYLYNVPVEKRFALYAAILELLDSSIDSCESIILIENVPGKANLDFMNKYLTMLRDVVKAASVLVSYENNFTEVQLNKDYFNTASESEKRLTRENFRNCELSIYKSIMTQIEIAGPYIKIYHESHIKTLSKDSRIRYDKSFHEFEKYYEEYGKSLLPSK